MLTIITTHLSAYNRTENRSWLSICLPMSIRNTHERQLEMPMD